MGLPMKKYPAFAMRALRGRLDIAEMLLRDWLKTGDKRDFYYLRERTRQYLIDQPTASRGTEGASDD